MSKLIVEVCRVEEVSKHPNADKLEICRIKGWLTVVKKEEFKQGDLCVFFPPDSILPPAICHGPEDSPPGRMNNIKYLHQLPKDAEGNRPPGGRVVATRLRGHVSYGVILPLDSTKGDNPEWVEGQDVAEHFGVTKYEPIESNAGDAERSNPRFYKYTSIENYANYPKAFEQGEEVVFTEKIHGKNCRVGLILEDNEAGEAEFVFAAGSHDVRRKEFSPVETRYAVPELIEAGVCKETPAEGDIFKHDDRYWIVDSVFEAPIYKKKNAPPISFWRRILNYFWSKKDTVTKVQCREVKSDIDHEIVLVRSEFWIGINEQTKALLEYVRDEFDWHEPKFSIMLYGELYGMGVQDMQYGMFGRAFRTFDLSINNQYIDFDKKTELFSKFGIEMAPVLYRGPFSTKAVEEYTSGPTTLCDPKAAGSFKGREGIVVSPVKEEHYNSILNGRKIAKSVSADYHARKGGTEFH